MSPEQQLERLDSLLRALQEAQRQASEIAKAYGEFADRNKQEDLDDVQSWLADCIQMTNEVREVVTAELEAA